MIDGLRLHHSGFVVASIEATMPGMLRSLGAIWDGRITADPIQRVKVAFLKTSDRDAQIELVEPDGQGSPVTRFLTERGGGLHHLCYEVEDLEGQITAMRSRGVNIVRRPQPAVAFDGRRIAWLLTPEKLLVELLETERRP